MKLKYILKEVTIKSNTKTWDFTKYIPNFDPKKIKIGDTIKANSVSDLHVDLIAQPPINPDILLFCENSGRIWSSTNLQNINNAQNNIEEIKIKPNNIKFEDLKVGEKYRITYKYHQNTENTDNLYLLFKDNAEDGEFGMFDIDNKSFGPESREIYPEDIISITRIPKSQQLDEIQHIIYKIDVLIKTDTEQNKTFVYNSIRGLPGVVTVNVDQNDYLDSQATDKYEYSLLRIKYMVISTPEEDIHKIKKQAMITEKIEGLVQFIPRNQTIQKIGEY